MLPTALLAGRHNDAAVAGVLRCSSIQSRECAYIDASLAIFLTDWQSHCSAESAHDLELLRRTPTCRAARTRTHTRMPCVTVTSVARFLHSCGCRPSHVDNSSLLTLKYGASTVQACMYVIVPDCSAATSSAGCVALLGMYLPHRVATHCT